MRWKLRDFVGRFWKDSITCIRCRSSTGTWSAPIYWLARMESSKLLTLELPSRWKSSPMRTLPSSAPLSKVLLITWLLKYSKGPVITRAQTFGVSGVLWFRCWQGSRLGRLWLKTSRKSSVTLCLEFPLHCLQTSPKNANSFLCLVLTSSLPKD